MELPLYPAPIIVSCCMLYANCQFKCLVVIPIILFTEMTVNLCIYGHSIRNCATVSLIRPTHFRVTHPAPADPGTGLELEMNLIREELSFTIILVESTYYLFQN